MRLARSERKRARTQTAAAAERSEALVFTTGLGKPLHPRNDYRTFKNLVKNARLPEIRLHDLRHTAASNMLTEGIHARVVMETLGHSTFDLTMNTYSHVAPKVSRDAADTMATALWGSTPSGDSLANC